MSVFKSYLPLFPIAITSNVSPQVLFLRWYNLTCVIVPHLQYFIDSLSPTWERYLSLENWGRHSDAQLKKKKKKEVNEVEGVKNRLKVVCDEYSLEFLLRGKESEMFSAKYVNVYKGEKWMKMRKE